MSTINNHQKKLENALQKLTILIEKLLNSIKISDSNNIDHIKTLNEELKNENTLLKEQLFSAIANTNNLKNKNALVYQDIEDVIEELEQLEKSKLE